MQDLKELNEVITAIKEEIRQGAGALTTSKSVYEFKKTFLDNKQGRIGLLMKEMRNVANDQKAEFGKTINGAKEWANNFFDELDQKLKEKEQQQRYESEKIDITYLSDKMCMSGSTLYRKMKALTGLSTNEYIRKVKMQNAERLLLEGKYNISEIAYKVGMNSTGYFRQCFKDEFGVSPSDYLKLIKQE